MKNHSRMLSFLSGAAAVTLVAGLAVPALALSGKITYGEAGISLFGDTVVSVGDTYTASDGEKIPAVITYTNASGGKVNYIAVREIADLFDVAGISWDGAKSSVEFAPSSDDVTITISDPVEIGANDSTVIGTNVAKDAPELGIKAGPFTEIDPSAVDTSRRVIYHLDAMTVESKTGFTNQMIDCGAGNTIVLTVTNNGDTVQYLNVCRRPAISYGQVQRFTAVKVLPGKTVSRAFVLDKDASKLTRELEWGLDGSIAVQGDDTKLTVTVKEYEYNYAARS